MARTNIEKSLLKIVSFFNFQGSANHGNEGGKPTVSNQHSQFEYILITIDMKNGYTDFSAFQIMPISP